MRSIKKAKASFDMNGDGIADDTGWVGKGDGFLVIDRNNDGKITDASELSFAAEDRNARSDLEALAALDNNGDRVINKDDARFGELKVWVDANGNGTTDQGELKTLTELGITEISLVGRNIDSTAKLGDNVLISTATYTRTNGSVGTVGNAALAYNPGKTVMGSAAVTGADGSGFVLPDRLNSENPDVGASMISGNMEDVNSLSPIQQAVAILRASKRENGLFVPPAIVFEEGGVNANIFDYYEQLGQASTTSVTPEHETMTQRLAYTGDNDITTQDLPTTSRAEVSRLSVLDMEAVTDRATPLLARIAQDMAVFGARSGESELSWRRDGAKPIDYFA
jgi:hypothetical protein